MATNKKKGSGKDSDSYSDNEFQKPSSIDAGTEEFHEKATINTTNYKKASNMNDFEILQKIGKLHHGFITILPILTTLILLRRWCIFTFVQGQETRGRRVLCPQESQAGPP